MAGGNLVGVCHGFVGNRILAARQREAQKLLNEGVLPWEVDDAFDTFGFKMVHFKCPIDPDLILVGKGSGNRKCYPRPIMQNESARPKTGAGYYDYDEIPT